MAKPSADKWVPSVSSISSLHHWRAVSGRWPPTSRPRPRAMALPRCNNVYRDCQARSFCWGSTNRPVHLYDGRIPRPCPPYPNPQSTTPQFERSVTAPPPWSSVGVVPVLEEWDQEPPQVMWKVPSAFPWFNFALRGTNCSPEWAESRGATPHHDSASARLKVPV